MLYRDLFHWHIIVFLFLSLSEPALIAGGIALGYHYFLHKKRPIAELNAKFS